MKKAILDIIKDQRKFLKIDQATLAEKSGLSQSTISQVENGSKNLSLDSLQKVCEVLNLEVQVVPKTDETLSFVPVSIKKSKIVI